MKPSRKWVKDWKLGLDPVKEEKIGLGIIEIFIKFWNQQCLDEKSKTTRNRYSKALHALGGYLLKKAHDNSGEIKPHSLILEYVDNFEGPLIHHDCETWQNEIDMVCRKLYKHMNS